jgi:hypothetical protein
MQNIRTRTQSPETIADPTLGSRRRPDAHLLRLLAYAEYALLYVLALHLLALGGAVLGSIATSCW